MTLDIQVPFVDLKAQFRQYEDETMGAIRNVMERGDFILGKEVETLEREFETFCNVKHAISVANGTDAIILALRALDIGSGDEVITVANSWVSTTASIALVGATPVFVDVGPDQNMNPELLEKAITKKTKAILPVHLAGRCAKMREINKIADSRGLHVIDDAAQAVGSTLHGVKTGSLGLLSTFSLHPLKNLNAAGDGGMITTNDDKLAHKLRLLRHHGLKNRDEVEFWGYNSRLDTIQAAIVSLRIKRLNEVIEARRRNARFYIEGFSDLVTCPVEKDGELHTYHTFTIQCDRRNELKEYLTRRGVDPKIHYVIPIHLQNAARSLNYPKGSLPVTENQSERILSLPIQQFLQPNQLNHVVECVRDFYTKC